MMTSPSRAGVTPLSIQLAACGQVTSPCRVKSGPLTVISIPRAPQTADEPAPGRCASRSPAAGGVPIRLSHRAKPGRRRSSAARSLFAGGDAASSGTPVPAVSPGRGPCPGAGRRRGLRSGLGPVTGGRSRCSLAGAGSLPVLCPVWPYRRRQPWETSQDRDLRFPPGQGHPPEQREWLPAVTGAHSGCRPGPGCLAGRTGGT